jgi:hypothetical protein
MSEGHDGSLDLADIEVTLPPSNWKPDIVDPVLDLLDLDEEPEA